jgi:hypothetical protein
MPKRRNPDGLLNVNTKKSMIPIYLNTYIRESGRSFECQHEEITLLKRLQERIAANNLYKRKHELSIYLNTYMGK